MGQENGKRGDEVRHRVLPCNPFSKDVVSICDSCVLKIQGLRDTTGFPADTNPLSCQSR